MLSPGSSVTMTRGVPIAAAGDGGCFDGLMATGINLQSGRGIDPSLHLAALDDAEVFGTGKQAGQLRSIAGRSEVIRRYLTRAHDPIRTPSA